MVFRIIKNSSVDFFNTLGGLLSQEVTHKIVAKQWAKEEIADVHMWLLYEVWSGQNI